MARFTASFPRAFRPVHRTPEGASRSPPPRPHPAAGGDARRGPGWFDSNWELQCGLEVREGLPEDAKLHEWMEVCLRS